MNTDRLKLLFARYLQHTATPEEERELMEIIANPLFEEEVKSIIDSEWDLWKSSLIIDHSRSEVLYENILKEINRAPVLKPRGQKWYWIAASLILLSGLGTYFLVNRQPDVTHRFTAMAPVVEDVVSPSTAHSTILLANGKTILVDSLKNLRSIVQGNATLVTKSDGSVAYEKNSGSQDAAVYNTLTVPRGSQIAQLTLSDGTKVWLNNESSIRYPTAFGGKTRQVTITGEAYFEVVHKNDSPFIVEIGEQHNGSRTRRVEVLGTHFNINSYGDEPSVATTLLQGRVKVVIDKKTLLLTPGNQARYDKEGNLYLVKNVNAKNTILWKEGYFNFENATIDEVMRQLSRWYNINVVYNGRQPKELFSGEIGKSLSLQQVLDLLIQVKIKYKLETGRKLTITF